MNEETYKNFVNYSSFEKHDVPNKEYFTKLINGLESEVLELKARIKDFPDIPGYKSEIGDVLWYITALANHINIDMNEIREYNAKKLNSRHDLGMK